EIGSIIIIPPHFIVQVSADQATGVLLMDKERIVRRRRLKLVVLLVILIVHQQVAPVNPSHIIAQGIYAVGNDYIAACIGKIGSFKFPHWIAKGIVKQVGIIESSMTAVTAH